VQDIVSKKQGSLLSFGALGTIWAASSGMYAAMQQLNITYDVKEGRSFFKARGTALFLTALFGALVVGAFGLVVLGGVLQEWVTARFSLPAFASFGFAATRWGIILAGLMMAFAVMYYFGPDVEQKFRFVSPGSVLGAILLIAASLGFRVYVEQFSDYSATYGSIGAVIILMLWLNILGLVLLLGSEINALFEHYSPEGKDKGEKLEPDSPGARSGGARAA
jgi:membrane protein